MMHQVFITNRGKVYHNRKLNIDFYNNLKIKLDRLFNASNYLTDPFVTAAIESHSNEK